MDNHIKKILDDDTNGLLTYEYIANNMGTVDADLPALIDNMIMKDRTGQFVVSTARYLNAINMQLMDVTEDEVLQFINEREEEVKVDRPIPMQQDYLKPVLVRDSLPDFHTWIQKHKV